MDSCNQQLEDLRHQVSNNEYRISRNRGYISSVEGRINGLKTAHMHLNSINNNNIPKTISQEYFNKTESAFTCPENSICESFSSLSSCDEKMKMTKDGSFITCVEEAANRTVEYFRSCVESVVTTCYDEPPTLFSFRESSKAICETKTKIICSEVPTGKFIDGPSLVKGIHRVPSSSYGGFLLLCGLFILTFGVAQYSPKKSESDLKKQRLAELAE